MISLRFLLQIYNKSNFSQPFGVLGFWGFGVLTGS